MLIDIKIIILLTSNAKQAIFAFTGVYKGLDAISLTSNAIDYAQTHFKILSGFMEYLNIRFNSSL